MTDSTSAPPIYLDHAAAMPLDPLVLAAMQPYFTDRFYNPSALYSQAQLVKADLASARQTVAGYLGARPSEVIFTAGGSEANNLAISGVMRRYPEAGMLVSAIEHDSVLAASVDYHPGLIEVDAAGIVQSDGVQARIDDRTVLISLMYANNEIGTIQPIKEIAAIIQAVRRNRQVRGVELPLYLHVDASQAANYLGLQTARMGADLLTVNGGKIYGPKQSGALYVKTGVELKPLIYGGGQERGLRSGTENLPAIIGFAKALQLAQDSRLDESRRLQALQQYFFIELARLIPTVVINGSRKHRLPNNLHITLPGTDNERMLFELDERGIMAAAGSACSASSDTPSHVLRALGLSDEVARSSLRFTMGRSTTQAELDRLLRILVELRYSCVV